MKIHGNNVPEFTVSELQTSLNRHGSQLKVDDLYGPKTGRAITKFKKKHGLYASAVITRQVYDLLFGGARPAKPPSQSPTDWFTMPRRSIRYVFVHCSASDHAAHDNIATMRRWHLARGWSDVGYHYFIRKDGTLEYGRPIGRVPAAQGGRNVFKKSTRPGAHPRAGNQGTVAICLHGLEKDKFTEAQFRTLRALCKEIDRETPNQITFHGHNEVAPKACPVFDHRAVLKLDSRGRLGV